MNEMTAYESALGCKEGSDGATKETEETTNKRNDEVVSGDWVANEGRGNGGGLDGWGCLMVPCTLASHANLTTSYKPVSVHSWCRVKCEVSSRQQTVRGEGYEREGGDFPMEKGDALRSRALRWCIGDCQGHAQYCTVSKLGNEGITVK